MNKTKILPERPKPPNYDDIIEDVDRAPKDDVVFSSFISPSPEDFEKTMSMEESYLDTSEMDSDMIQPQEEAYQQAVQFLRLQNKLTSAPKILDEQYKKLEELGSEVSKSIRSLKESSEALQDNT